MSKDESLETAITISVNGESRSAKAGASVSDLLRELGLESGRVAIERNLEILPRPQWPETLVQRGDRYEIAGTLAMKGVSKDVVVPVALLGACALSGVFLAGCGSGTKTVSVGGEPATSSQAATRSRSFAAETVMKPA